jgi:imidazole glycerol-phosphate synthase subunit HisH
VSRVVIIENGGANIASLRFALERLDCVPQLTSNAEAIRAATHVILPGVGAAADGMARLRERGLEKVLPDLPQPVLGICLGMQLLYEASEEGNATCLGAIPGTAKRFAPAPGRPVPHMGWNRLEQRREDSHLLDGIGDNAWAWFANSYALPVGAETLATAEYGEPFSAVVAHRNFYGAQFHPERSGRAGAALLQNFLATG